MAQFHPENHGFVRLRGFQNPGGIDVVEYRNHAAADGTPDFLRLNVYLSKDRNFVCIWHGLVEPVFAEGAFSASQVPDDFDLGRNYNTELFRGHLESDHDATVVLKSLRIAGAEYAPHQLRAGAEGLRCDRIPTA